MRACGCHRGGGAGHLTTSRADPRRPFLGAVRPSTFATVTRISPPPLAPTTPLNAITNRVATDSFPCPARPLGLRPAALRTAIGEGRPASNVERRPSHVACQGRELRRHLLPRCETSCVVRCRGEWDAWRPISCALTSSGRFLMSIPPWWRVKYMSGVSDLTRQGKLLRGHLILYPRTRQPTRIHSPSENRACVLPMGGWPNAGFSRDIWGVCLRTWPTARPRMASLSLSGQRRPQSSASVHPTPGYSV